MIKFFQKIRQNLLSEGKFGKYLKYAFGEIVLVVLGILIALQINNWNEDRKNRNLERVFLTNIQNDISLDTLDLGFNRMVHKKALENEILLLRLLDKDPYINPDSINVLEIPLSELRLISKSYVN